MSDDTPFSRGPAGAAARYLPPSGRLLGIDFGTIRVGLSSCDENRLIASSLETLTRKDDATDATYFRQLVARERVVGLVVGLPLHMSGDESPKSKEARLFGSWLAGVTGLPIAFWDERHTSSIAEEFLAAAGLKRDKRKGKVDRLAAQLILQSFLDAGCPAATFAQPPPAADPD